MRNQNTVTWLIAVAALLLGALFSVSQRGTPSVSPALLTQPLPTISGETLVLRDELKQPVLVNFWAEWCPPCRREIPLLAAWHQQQQGHAKVIGISMDNAETAVAASRELAIPFAVVADPATALQLSTAFGNHAGALPYTVLLTPDGQLAYRKVGELSAADLEKITEKL